MKLNNSFESKALALLKDIEENRLTTDETREKYYDLIEFVFEELQENYDMYGSLTGVIRDSYWVRDETQSFIMTIKEIRRNCNNEKKEKNENL